jgi:hypothetical protein
VEPLFKATLRETREHNERLVLATIYDDGPVRMRFRGRTGFLLLVAVAQMAPFEALLSTSMHSSS